MRSWHKRWFYLDFQAGVVLMYKRSYWKSPRGVIDLRNVAHIEKMSQETSASSSTTRAPTPRR